jgi:hypothetical protein
VVAGKQGELRTLLADSNYRGTAPPQDPLGFASLAMVHYASMFLYDDPEDGWSFVFENNIDGTVSDYIDALAKSVSGDDQHYLLRIFRLCQGFDGDSRNVATYLEKFVQQPSTRFTGTVGRSRQQILFESQLHDAASAILDDLPTGTSEGVAAKTIRDSLANDPALKHFSDVPKATPSARDLLKAQSLSSVPKKEGGGLKSASIFIVRVIRALIVALFKSGPLTVIKALFAIIVFLLLGIWNQLRKEPSAPVDEKRPDPAHVRTQKAMEDFIATNHMVSVVHLHHDFSRRYAKWAAFVLLDLLARFEFNKGTLGAIPTIHFAHWAVINNGRRLLFVSNFDGNWDSYLDDFVLKAASGLTLAWAHGKGFPTSTFMFKGGAAHGPEFIDWARRSMVPTLVWYKAYPNLSIRNINRNSALRQAIAEDTEAVNKDNWLELIQ